MDTHSKDTSDFLSRAYALNSVSAAQTLYNEWAESYDTYLDLEGYAFPERAVQVLLKVIQRETLDESVKVLDAGCGTGRVGAVLAQKGARQIDGIDLSPGMLAQAEKSHHYASLQEVDLTKTIPKPDESYDVVICVGTLTQGHVGPAVLDEFIRVVKVGGVVVATIPDTVWEAAGFSTKIDQLLYDGRVALLRSDAVGILKTTTSGARILALERK
ncbi:hypothetical protein PV10_08052 [Exophiala mesophila]|uniref:Methyltransferase domain-containing protein n=1 Tax=Exophiala mesophila TaxID=212818 RepID=A0A0D1XJI7_EXOME|nr:uncharacterized protein PV10_08052 [Exophiala mesophila]KIV88361.1 hypothetical protein PV10_08052 [Exophiala mesophila]